LGGLMIQSQRSEMESYQRVQALQLLQDMASRINANRATAQCYAFTNTLISGSPYVGPAGGLASPYAQCNTGPSPASAASAAETLQWQNDVTEWTAMLQGAGEADSNNNKVGAMVGARGCISYALGTELLDRNGTPIPYTGIYTIAVAWQGLSDTVAPLAPVAQAPTSTPPAAQNCGINSYTRETLRRIVTLNMRVASVTVN
jgi:type IV pilus assembly protein PilV